MRPLPRAGLTFAGVLAILALFFVVRWIVAAGLFAHVAAVSPGACTPLTELAGPEDFEIDAAHNAILVSSSNRRVPGLRDGLYMLTLNRPAAPPVRLAGPPRDFHPHGISLYHAPDGSETLMAVNHRADGGEAIEIFAVHYEQGAARLTYQSSVQSRLLVSPNDIFAVSPTQFYVTNDHATRTPLGRFAEDDLLWPHADLLYFNGLSFKIAVQRIGFPNSVLVSPDGAHLYVTSTSERRLIAFSRETFTGNLKEVGSLALPARPDNIAMDAKGDLWIAGQPSLIEDRNFRADAQKPSSSAVFRVHLDKDGVPQSYDTVYASNGAGIGASSAAAPWNGHLFIGSVLDDKMLDCRMK